MEVVRNMKQRLYRRKDLEAPPPPLREENCNWKAVKEGIIRERQDEDATEKDYGGRNGKRIPKEMQRESQNEENWKRPWKIEVEREIKGEPRGTGRKLGSAKVKDIWKHYA